MLDYASLRREGIRQLERMAGGVWTDFNAHDPGITILEQLCYALTDLGYRIAYDLPDLLSGGGGEPYASLYPSPEILSCDPVTLDDLRRVALAVDGVRNAWIEPVEDPWITRRREEGRPLHYHPGRRELRLGADPPASEPLQIRGLYRVRIETSDLAGTDGTAVAAAVARRLHRHRGLCQDFTDIEVLPVQRIRVAARVEIGSVEDADAVLLGTLERLADQISPRVPFIGLDRLLAAGRPIDEIFDGPLLGKGFLDPRALRRTGRRTRINTSDLVHAIMEVPGVRAVPGIGVSAGGATEAWSLACDPGMTPQLDLDESKIELLRAGVPVGVDAKSVIDAYAERRRRAAMSGARATESAAWSELAPPAGRDRRAGRYQSVQHQFPATYGIGRLGLSDSAPAERQAQAKQLRGYLMLFDQLLANGFAQLEQARELFSFDGDALRSYFAQPLTDPWLGLDELRRGDPETHLERLQRMTEDAEAPAAGKRTNRFLSHLLARFAEQFADYALALADALPGDAEALEGKLARDKRAFLRRYPRISAARGTAFDCLRSPGTDNRSGLEERLRLKLGLEEERGEDLLLVEHVLLRPMTGDEGQTVPLLAAADRKDPYSLQLTLAAPAAGRFAHEGFRRFAEQTIRRETPAHLTAYVRWLGPAAWTDFKGAFEGWLQRLRELRRQELGLGRGKDG